MAVRRKRSHVHAAPRRTDADAGRRAQGRELRARARVRRRRWTRLRAWRWWAHQRSAQAGADRRRAGACRRQRCYLCAQHAPARASHSSRRRAADGRRGPSQRAPLWMRCDAGLERRLAVCSCTRPRRRRVRRGAAGARICAVGSDVQSGGCQVVGAADRCGVEWLDPTRADGQRRGSASRVAQSAAAIGHTRSGVHTQSLVASSSSSSRCIPHTPIRVNEWDKGTRSPIESHRFGSRSVRPSLLDCSADRSCNTCTVMPSPPNSFNVSSNALSIIIADGDAFRAFSAPVSSGAMNSSAHADQTDRHATHWTHPVRQRRFYLVWLARPILPLHSRHKRAGPLFPAAAPGPPDPLRPARLVSAHGRARPRPPCRTALPMRSRCCRARARRPLSTRDQRPHSQIQSARGCSTAGGDGGRRAQPAR